MRDIAGITTLRERREEICDKIAAKLLANPRFSAFFPRKETRTSDRSGKKKEVFLELKACFDRLKNSLIYYFRRRMNGKPGKSYGKRNEKYR